MNAIIRIGNGDYYCSAVFGIYNDEITTHNSFNMYCIVFDKDKKRLVKQPMFNPEIRPFLDKMVLIFNTDHTDWELDENGYGGVDFLPKEDALKIIEDGGMPDEILNRCLQIDSMTKLRDIQYCLSK